MKRLAFLCMIWLSLAGISSPLSNFDNGNYLGSGNWRDDNGNSGSYQSYIEFFYNNTTASYAWSQGAASFQLYFLFDYYGNFDVYQNDNYVGEGYCMSSQCQYFASLDNVDLNEVWTFGDGQLFKLGSTSYDSGMVIYYEENLWAVQSSSDKYRVAEPAAPEQTSAPQ